jgi:hypothetical protein
MLDHFRCIILRVCFCTSPTNDGCESVSQSVINCSDADAVEVTNLPEVLGVLHIAPTCFVSVGSQMASVSL